MHATYHASVYRVAADRILFRAILPTFGRHFMHCGYQHRPKFYALVLRPYLFLLLSSQESVSLLLGFLWVFWI